MKHITTLLLMFSALLLAPAAALAQPSRARAPVWDVTLGVAGALRPTFEGSDRYIATPLPLVAVKWRDMVSFGEGGLNAYWHRRNFRIGAGLTFDPGRKDHGTGGIFDSGDDRLAGLGKIDASLGLRAFAEYRLGPLAFEVSGIKFTGGQNSGLLANLDLSMPLPLGKKLIVMPHARATWADGTYNQTYFGVTPAQAAASIFPAFTAHSGVKDVRGGVNLIWRFNRHWFASTDVSVVRLMADAALSPISISDTNAMAMTMLGYRF
jgi:outer membrane protein